MSIKYPIILVHGLFGFDKIGDLPYFYGVEEALIKTGAKIFTATLSAANNNEIRGEQLWQYVQKTLRDTGAKKVNLIGHSQGPLACRYVASLHPREIASVTSICGVNHGSEFADKVREEFKKNSWQEKVVASVTNTFSGLISGLSGGKTKPQDSVVSALNALATGPATNAFVALISGLSGGKAKPQDSVAALDALTTKGVAEFNKKYPQGLPSTWGGEGKPIENGVLYYSWGGYIKDEEQGNNIYDPFHLLMKACAVFFIKEKQQNDGVVGRYSMHLGKVISTEYSLDHFDAVNHFKGITPSNIDVIQLFIEHAKRLEDAGV